jgi:hypothetical protein
LGAFSRGARELLTQGSDLGAQRSDLFFQLSALPFRLGGDLGGALFGFLANLQGALAGILEQGVDLALTLLEELQAFLQ